LVKAAFNDTRGSNYADRDWDIFQHLRLMNDENEKKLFEMSDNSAEISSGLLKNEEFLVNPGDVLMIYQ
jgi:hypothetical protein